MDKQVSSVLNHLLDQYDVRQSKIEKQRRTKQDQNELFLQYFEKGRKDVIRPCLEKIKAVLVERGHQCQITERDVFCKEIDTQEEANIQFIICPKGSRDENMFEIHRERFPSIAFNTRTYEKKIWVSVRTFTGTGRYTAEFEVTEIQESLINTHVLEALKEILDK